MGSKLTYDVVMEKAKEFTTTGAFRAKYGGYMAWARRNGHVESITAHMKKGRQPKWTTPMLKIEADKYNTRRAFQDGSKGAYLHALANGKLDSLCTHMTTNRKNWDEKSCRDTALKFTIKEEFSKAYRGAFTYALRNGILDDVCSHMTPLRVNWTTPQLYEEAKKYTNRSAFRYGNYTAYSAAQRRGILQHICAHMPYHDSSTDDDCLYIWKLVDEYFNGVQLYKIGVTSVRLGSKRIEICANSGGFEYDIIIMKEVPKASVYEKEFLTYGANPKLKGFEGATEVRALTDNEIDTILAMI